jgi:hypothetical protein
VVALMGTPLGKDEIGKMKDEGGVSPAMLGALFIENLSIVFFLKLMKRK